MEGQTNQKILCFKLQRKLRNASTDAERHLWQFLRRRQMLGAKFRRQHPFGNYILDFACLEQKIAIELDGGQHAVSGQYDADRTAQLKKAGFVVLRFWDNEVFENPDGVLDVIWNTVRSRQTHPLPDPPGPRARRSGVRSGASQWLANAHPHPLEGEGEGAGC